MKICDIMTDHVITVGADEPVTAAARLLKSNNIGSLPVCDSSGRLQGMVTDRDIVLRCVSHGADPGKMTVSEVMSRGVVTAAPLDDVDKAVQLMSRDQIRRLPVTEEGKVVGLVALCDMARSCNCEMEAAEALTEISANIKRK